jgi:plasmid stability protein
MRTRIFQSPRRIFMLYLIKFALESTDMTDLLIRNLDEDAISRLKARAAAENLPIEQTAREILKSALEDSTTQIDRLKVWADIDRVRREIGPIAGDSTATIREWRDHGRFGR